MGVKDVILVFCGCWVKILEKDKWIQQMCMQWLKVKLQMLFQSGEFKVLIRCLQVEFWFLSKQMVGCLEDCMCQVFESFWEEQLVWLLQEVFGKLSFDVEQVLLGQYLQVQFLGQQQRFLVFFKCCLFIDQLFFVYYLLVVYYGQWQKWKLFMLDMYNVVMFGWVWQGVFKELVYVLFMVKDVGLILDLLFYVVVFQCMGRQDQDVGIIERCLEQMSQEGLKLQVFFIVVLLFEEDWVIVLKVVYKVKFIFSFLLQLLFLVNIFKLFRDVYVKDGCVFYLKLYLFLKILQCFFEKQFYMELVSRVCVVFVEKFMLLSKEVKYVWKILKILWD